MSLWRSVEIRVTNNSHDVTLHSPRSFCFSGHCSTPPAPRVPPGVTETCRFTNNPLTFRGCVGLLVYEAETFTLAVFFSNPFNYNLYPVELALEISLLKVHLLGDLEATYARMAEGGAGGGATREEDGTYQRVTLAATQEPVAVAAGRVKVEATMANATASVVKVLLEDAASSPPRPPPLPPRLNLGW